MTATVWKDRVWERDTVTGTGTLTLSGNAQIGGFQSFSAAIPTGSQVMYGIIDSVAPAWEVGLGIYTTSGNTLTRATVLESSNSGALVNFAGNVCDVEVVISSPVQTSAGASSQARIPALNPSGLIDNSMLTQVQKNGTDGTNAINLTGSTTLTSAQSGTTYTTEGFPATGTITLPAATFGLWFSIYSNPTSTITLEVGSSIATPDGVFASTYVMPASHTQQIFLIADGTNWRAITTGRTIIANAVNANEAVALGQYSASFATTGYQKFPNGYMLQWGTYVWTGTGARTGTLTFPIAFPNQCLKMWSTDTGSAVAICAANPINASSGNLFMPAATLGSSSTPTTTGAYVSTWIAFGN